MHAHLTEGIGTAVPHGFHFPARLGPARQGIATLPGISRTRARACR
jgi:hypothetical protein